MKTCFYLFFAGVIFISNAYSVETNAIRALRVEVVPAKRELSTSEKQVISDFLKSGLDQMMLAPTSEEMVDIRQQIVLQKGSENLSYYATAYIDAAVEEIETAFSNAKRLDDSDQHLCVDRNLMVLVANLQSPDLAELALKRFDDADELVRYWAVKAVTQPSIARQLGSDVTGDDDTLEAILKALKQKVVNESKAEIQVMAVDFCVAFNHSIAREVLLSLAQSRTMAYADWTATDLSADVELLTALGNIAMIQTDPEIKKNFGRAFAELYAMPFQWYIKSSGDLTKAQMNGVLTVIAEIDRSVLLPTMKIQTGILQALRAKRGLEREYEILFGDRTRSGALAEMFKFDYGKDASGKTLKAPPKIGSKPKPTIYE